VPDPVQAAPPLRRRAFTDVVQLLSWRIDLMLMVRLGRGNLEAVLRRAATEKPEQSGVSSGGREP
jgi:hypothetical protein